MSFNSTSAEKARFTESRKGFDSDEVLAFQKSVTNALRGYEKELADTRTELENTRQRIADLEIAEEAVKRTFMAAGLTKQEMLSEAEKAAAETRSAAKADAEEMRSTAEADSNRLRTEAQKESEQMLTEASNEAARLLSEARAEADQTSVRAAAEHKRLEKRITQLRTALGSLEERLQVFATGALDEVATANDMIDLETKTLDEIAAFQDTEDAPTEEAPAAEGESAREQVHARATARQEEAEAMAEELITDAETLPAGGDAPEAMEATATELKGDAESSSGRDSFYSRRMGGLKQRLADSDN